MPDHHRSNAASSTTGLRHVAKQVRRTARDFAKYGLMPARQFQVEVSNRRGITLKYLRRPSMRPVHSILCGGGVAADFGPTVADRAPYAVRRVPGTGNVIRLPHRLRVQSPLAFTDHQTAASGSGVGSKSMILSARDVPFNSRARSHHAEGERCERNQRRASRFQDSDDLCLQVHCPVSRSRVRATIEERNRPAGLLLPDSGPVTEEARL